MRLYLEVMIEVADRQYEDGKRELALATLNPMFDLYGLYRREQFRIFESLSPVRSTIDDG